jgi:NhaP-type Na+/H+ or K+/H+ antiporter
VWFGPKGFASAFFGLLVLNSALPEGRRLFQVIALVILASVLAHSSTDVVIARWYRKQPAAADFHPAESARGRPARTRVADPLLEEKGGGTTGNHDSAS